MIKNCLDESANHTFRSTGLLHEAADVPTSAVPGATGHDRAGQEEVRVDEDTRVGAEKLCAALKAAGTYCDVWRN
jgi:hypothetical protein